MIAAIGVVSREDYNRPEHRSAGDTAILESYRYSSTTSSFQVLQWPLSGQLNYTKIVLDISKFR